MTTERSTIDREPDVSVDDPDTAPIEPILEALESADPSMADRAATALYTVAKSRPDRVIDADALAQAVRLLERDRPTIRTKAITTMALVGEADPDALEPYADACLEALEDDAALVRQGALRALRRVATTDPDAVRPGLEGVVSALDSELEPTRMHAAAILRRVVPGADEDVLHGVVEPLLDLLGDSYDPLSRSDISYDPTQTSAGATPADQLRGHRFLVADQQGRSSNTRAREAAAATLASIADDAPTAVADVLESRSDRVASLLRDRNRQIRGAVVAAVAAVAEADSAVVRPFEAHLVDSLEEPLAVSGHAVWALRHVDTAEARAALERVATGDDVPAGLRETAERAIADLEL